MSPQNLSIFSLFMVCALSTTQAAEWEAGPYGDTAFFQMEHTSYPHESRAEGHEYQGTKFPADPHYTDNTVAIFIPAGYQKGKEVHLIYYWHGWYNNVRKALDEFELRRQVAESGKNVILVFPEGPKDAADSRWGRLEEEGELALLTEEVMAALKAEERVNEEAELGRVILSGHSGAYRVLSFSAKLGGIENNIEEVYLLDASYALLEPFVDLLDRSPRVRLRSIYTEHLREDNEELIVMLQNRGFLVTSGVEEDITKKDLEEQNVIIMSTTERDHNEAVFVLKDWLAASRLPNVPGVSQSAQDKIAEQFKK